MTERKDKNPFTLSFSRKPAEYIPRRDQTDRILDTFTGDPVTDQIFIIMGIRGSGKTVLLSSIANQLSQYKDWTVIRCTPTGDIMENLAAELCSTRILNRLSLDVSLNIPLTGTVNISKNTASETDFSRIDNILEIFDRQGKKLLVTIDEVTNTRKLREFASYFQILIGKERPIYFLGTGLYENIMSLQNERNMTFLYRAPKIVLGPLNMADISKSYENTFSITEEESIRMAKLTNGYSFAFQALGYVYWEKCYSAEKAALEDIMSDYDRILADSSYSKMWIEMSDIDREICRAIAECSSPQVKDIRSALQMDSNLFNVYRRRLINRGILSAEGFGKIRFTLPRFTEFVNKWAYLYEII